MLQDERRGVDESYSSAIVTSNLRIATDKIGDHEKCCAGDVIIAAAWSESRIGGALLRLYTEFDAAERMRVATAEAFLPKGKVSKEQRSHAAKQAHAYNLHETALLLGKLKALPSVRQAVTAQLVTWGVKEPEAKSVEILRWWLQQRCHACHGVKFQVVEGTGRLSAKACPMCKGSGQREIPHGQEGRRCATFLDQCVERARASIGRRLRRDRGAS